MSLSEKLQYYALKQQLKRYHDKEVHDLEFKYAKIIVQLMREKKKVHQSMFDRYCNQMDQLNQSLFAAMVRENTKRTLDHYKHSMARYQGRAKYKNNKMKVEIPALNPLLLNDQQQNENAENAENEKLISPPKSGSVPVTDAEKIVHVKTPPLAMQFIFNCDPTSPQKASFEQVRQTLDDQKSADKADAMDVLLQAIESLERESRDSLGSTQSTQSSERFDDEDEDAEMNSNSNVNVKEEADDEEEEEEEDDDDDFDIERVAVGGSSRSSQWTREGDGFACNVCGKVLRRAYDIKRHIQCVHNDERPHKCDECGTRFKLGFHLKEHKLTHLAVRPFKCYFCERRFTRKRDITKHCKRMHKTQFAAIEDKHEQLNSPALF